MARKETRRVGELCLVLLSLGCGLVILEIALSARQALARRQDVARKQERNGTPLHVLLDSPELYGLNPQHPDVGAQGLRNDTVQVPKPDGLWRLLILGDSVTFGTGVDRQQAYPARLQEALEPRVQRPVEVINAGVPGYTPFNQLQYYRSTGRKLEADMVVVGFCMNDIANPRLHWDYTGSFLPDVPSDAIPNIEYDRRLAARRDSLWTRSALASALRRRAQRWFGADDPVAVPTFITGEDASLSITVLVDEASAEWRWLTSMYDQLHREVVADGAQLVIVIFPLEYQLDPDYPFLPQRNLARYCDSRSIPCLDVLPAFRQQTRGSCFLQKSDSMRDVWHLSARGHDLTATLLADLLTGNASMPPAVALDPSSGPAPQRGRTGIVVSQ
jgi:hypothetical protein